MTNQGITSPLDLYYLTKEQLFALEGFKDKKVQNFLDALNASKNISLVNFIYGLGIDNVGIVTARDLAKTFGSIDALQTATLEQLLEIEEVGAVVSQCIVDFFAGEYGKTLVEGLKKIGINPIDNQSHPQGIFSGKKVVLTGSLSTFTRSQAGKEIEKRGGTLSSAVTKDTNLVIVGENAGSKLLEAQKKGVEIWTEEEFLNAINN